MEEEEEEEEEEEVEEEEEDVIDIIKYIPEEAKEILYNLASNWIDVVDSEAIRVTRLKGAMTNEVYQIDWDTEEGMPPRTVLVRIYGEGVGFFFDREDEIRKFELISEHRQGPSLLGRFSIGRIEEFIHARTLSAADVRDPEISTLIAAKLKEFHNLKMPGSDEVLLWERLRKWLELALCLCCSTQWERFSLDCLDDEIDFLESKLTRNGQEIGFCHNDLQYGNIMMHEETRLVTFIDYEYAGYNPVAYDIANHFCEMAADYHTDTPHDLDFRKYPELEERKRFVHAYLGSSGKESTDKIEKLLEDIEKYTIACHLLWGLWGLVSDHLNEIDFDYNAYAVQRFHQYKLRKTSLLGPSAPLHSESSGS